MFTSINGQRIWYDDSGGSGPPVVFMHGFLLDLSMFDAQVDELAPDYRCVRFDARGFGRTEWDGEPFTLYDTVADCVGLMDHLGIGKAAVVGMSQGGYAALRLALRHPGRVSALVLMSTRSGVDEEEVKAGYREMRDTWRQAGPVHPLVEGLMSAIIGPKQATGEFWDVWYRKWRAIDGERIFHAMNALLDRDDIDGEVESITCPALVTHGEADEGVPIAWGEALDRALPGSTGLVRVPGAAHAANMTHAQVVNPPLRAYLDQHATGG